MRQTGKPPVKRNVTFPANPQNYGHYAGFHGEDQPYLSDDLEEDERFYVTKPHTSARRYQTTDSLVYPSDTLDHPSHYIFLNLNGTIMIVELPHGDPTHAKIYKGPSVYSDNAGYTPVTGEFKQVNGKIEMIVHVGDQQFIYLNDGIQFKPQQ